MKVTELRIGNWANNGERDYVLDRSSLQDVINFSEDDYTTDWLPIPLTEEWLKRGGMLDGQEPAYANYILKKGSYASSEIGWSIGIVRGKYWVFLISIDYVHQLQNAIFVLTTDEITFTNA
jgi:hypothetical protein